MAIGATPRTDSVALTNTAATTVKAGPASGIDRYIKHIKVVNGGAQTTYTLGLKASTTAPAAGDPGLIALTRTIAANSAEDIAFAGDGLKWTNGSGFNLNGSAGSASQVNIHLIYNEVAA